VREAEDQTGHSRFSSGGKCLGSARDSREGDAAGHEAAGSVAALLRHHRRKRESHTANTAVNRRRGAGHTPLRKPMKDEPARGALKSLEAEEEKLIEEVMELELAG